jgi:hypothetical protein
MWRFGFCVVALVAAPAFAQTMQYDDDHAGPRHRSEGSRIHQHFTNGSHRVRRHPGGFSARAIEPALLGPAPKGFWYRCDAPAGYYPYIPVCRTPWRFVPSVPPR